MLMYYWLSSISMNNLIVLLNPMTGKLHFVKSNLFCGLCTSQIILNIEYYRSLVLEVAGGEMSDVILLTCCSFSGIQKLKILQVTMFILSQVSSKTISVVIIFVLILTISPYRKVASAVKRKRTLIPYLSATVPLIIENIRKPHGM